MREYPVPNQGESFLYARMGGLGDVLEALADAYEIKKKFPGIKLIFMTQKMYASLAESQPYVDETVVGHKEPFSVVLKTIQMFRKRKFDWSASTYKGTHLTIMNYLGGIKYRLGCSLYAPFLETANLYKWAANFGINLRKRNGRCIFAPEESLMYAKKILEPLGGKKKLFCVIGASSDTKMWPLENWIRFLDPLAKSGWIFVLNGYGKREAEFAQKIEAAFGNDKVLNLVGKLNFVRMIGIVSECQAAVGNDTGPLHMAALCGIPTVGIFDYVLPVDFGYNIDNFRYVVARNEQLQVVYQKKREQALLLKIQPETVWEVFNELVN